MLPNVVAGATISGVGKVIEMMGAHGAVALILFVGFLVYFGTEAIGLLKEFTVGDRKWLSSPIPSKISLISRGSIGATIICYLAYLLIFSNIQVVKVLATLLIPATFGIGLSICILFFGVFGYFFLYQPLEKLVSQFKKKE